MRRNGNLWTSGVNLDTSVRFADPDFLLECKISAIWRRFPLIIAFYILNVRHISTSGLLDLLTYMAGHVSNPATKFEDPTTIFSCVESRDPWVGVKNDYILGIPDPDLPSHISTSGLFDRMREITWSVKGTLNVLLQSFSPTSIYHTGLQKLSI